MEGLPSIARERLLAVRWLALSLALAGVAPAAASPRQAMPGVAGAPSLGEAPLVDPRRLEHGPSLRGGTLPPITIARPDLVVASVEPIGEPVIDGRYLRLPLRIVVANRGRAASAPYVALRAFTRNPSGRTYVALNDRADPYPDEVLLLDRIEGGREVLVTTFLVVRSPFAGGPYVVFVEVDPKEMPSIYDLYVPTAEWDESNNVSRALPIFGE
jgi:hypothetical protein